MLEVTVTPLYLLCLINTLPSSPNSLGASLHHGIVQLLHGSVWYISAVTQTAFERTSTCKLAYLVYAVVSTVPGLQAACVYRACRVAMRRPRITCSTLKFRGTSSSSASPAPSPLSSYVAYAQSSRPAHSPAARLTKYSAIYHTIILSLSQDRLTTVTYVLEFLLRIPQAKTNNISDDLTILQEKPRVLRKMFVKLDVRRKSIVTLALS